MGFPTILQREQTEQREQPQTCYTTDSGTPLSSAKLLPGPPAQITVSGRIRIWKENSERAHRQPLPMHAWTVLNHAGPLSSDPPPSQKQVLRAVYTCGKKTNTAPFLHAYSLTILHFVLSSPSPFLIHVLVQRRRKWLTVGFWLCFSFTRVGLHKRGHDRTTKAWIRQDKTLDGRGGSEA